MLFGVPSLHYGWESGWFLPGYVFTADCVLRTRMWVYTYFFVAIVTTSIGPGYVQHTHIYMCLSDFSDLASEGKRVV